MRLFVEAIGKARRDARAVRVADLRAAWGADEKTFKRYLKEIEG